MSSGKVITPAEVEFWLDFDRYSQYMPPTSGDIDDMGSFNVDMIRLASIRKAIANFVRILTRKSVPVYFQDVGGSVNYEGKNIYISAALNCKADFDVAVGLALHEGAHSLLSDFDMVKNAWANLPPEILKVSDSKHIRRSSIERFIRDMWNVVEDRYIDNYVFNEAPGYRGYYAALYDRYYHCEEIDKQLQSDNFRFPSLKSYDFRISAFINENTDLLALPRLEEIAQVLDISHIDRLTTTLDRIKNAFEVVKIVLDCVDKDDSLSLASGKSKSKQRQTRKANGLADPHDYFDFGDDPEEEEGQQEETKGGDDEEEIDVGQDAISEIGDILTGRNKNPEELGENKSAVTKTSDEDLEKDIQKEAEKAVEAQRKFLNGEIPKREVSEAQKGLLDLIEKHGIIMVRVDFPKVLAGDSKSLKVDCIVVQKMTKDLIFSGTETFPLCSAHKMGEGEPEAPKEVADAVKKGIQLGTKLGRKLQIRAEENPIKVVRKKSGKINRRQLHEASFDAEDLFYHMDIEKHSDANLHISVDASSSMSGKKWARTMTSVVAICKAASMIDNVHVTVSFRATQDSKGLSFPYIVLAYDSKTDKFSKVRNLFPHLIPNGCTPEGLALSAIMDLFENITPDEEERYFLNLSDGEPCFYLRSAQNILVSYDGETGVSHTKSQVDKIRRHGVKILSYFIEEDNSWRKHLGAKLETEYKQVDNTLLKNFRRMYGPSAKFIEINDVVSLAKTINELFLTKNEK